jgi:thiamine-phosphate pyrophosphorylase
MTREDDRIEIPRLYLIAQGDERPAGEIERALATADVACLLLRRHSPDIEPLIRAAQALGVAVLIPEDMEAAQRLSADGVHVEGQAETVAPLRGTLGGRILGFGGAARRHEAMTAGEGAADYVCFGRLLDDAAPLPLDQRLDLVGWWAEVFEVPCVVPAFDGLEAGALARAGADFIALPPGVWLSTDDPNGALGAISEAIARAIEEEETGV